MSETPCSETSDTLNSRKTSTIERLDGDDVVEEQSDGAHGELSHRSAIELQIPIYVETLTGNTFKLLVSPSDTIINIKSQLENAEGVPLSHQHLIWRNQELRNEFTVEDYGIAFGTTLRLVISLRGGPVSKSPIFFANNSDIDETISNSDSSQSRPLTVLLFQNGDQIQMFTLSPNQSIADETQSQFFDPSIYSENTANEEINEFKRREDENMRLKMKEIQMKMNLLASRRIDNRTKITDESVDKQNNNQIQSNNTTKLPLLENALNLNSETINLNKNRETSLDASAIHLPQIINNSVGEDNTLKSAKTLRLQKQLSIKRMLQSNDSEFKTNLMKRPNSSSQNELNDPIDEKISSFNNYSELWSQLLLIDDKKESTSTLGSMLSSKPIRRPQTTPFVGRITSNNMASLKKAFEMDSCSRQVLPRKQTHYKVRVKSRKINSPQKLPPLNLKRKANKIRCSFCRTKVGIISKFECRSVLTISLCNKRFNSKKGILSLISYDLSLSFRL
jgi:AN1-type zinc finger and ubiquitin domain-containing protein 1